MGVALFKVKVDPWFEVCSPSGSQFPLCVSAVPSSTQGEGRDNINQNSKCKIQCMFCYIIFFSFLQLYKGRDTARPRYHQKVIYPDDMLEW
jgi:hypothetical protein